MPKWLGLLALLANLQALNGLITKPTPIIGTVHDATLQSYRVDIAPVDKIDPTNVAADSPLYRTTGTANVSDAQVALLDPTLLDNGSYFVRIIATNLNGNTNARGVILTIGGDLKLGRFFYSTTDLSVPPLPISGFVSGRKLLLTAGDREVRLSVEAGMNLDLLGRGC